MEEYRHAVGTEDREHYTIDLAKCNNKSYARHLNGEEERGYDVCHSLGAHHEGQHSENQRYNQIYKHGALIFNRG
jgi:hypothetical protein